MGTTEHMVAIAGGVHEPDVPGWPGPSAAEPGLSLRGNGSDGDIAVALDLEAAVIVLDEDGLAATHP